MNVPRPEYPRPQMVRDNWICLNGQWDFAFDDQNCGLREKWFRVDRPFEHMIQVPFAYQSVLSGHGVNEMHDVVWYRRKIDIAKVRAGNRVILHFGAVDYLAHVWVNGDLAIIHEGGHVPFAADITDWVVDDNIIVVRAEDPAARLDQPRGKQYWEPISAGIFYTRTTGIWQSVWIEIVPPVYISRLKITPDISSNSVDLQCHVEGMTLDKAATIEWTVLLRDQPVARDSCSLKSSPFKRRVTLNVDGHPERDVYWSPEHPNLFDLTVTVRTEDGSTEDMVTSYFGLRSIAVKGGVVMLNNRPYYMKMVLDQGYFPEGILTPPTDDAIRRDIELTKEMGFNGARKHQKVEDPRYLYWCDHLGLLVWGEMANSYLYSEQAVQRIGREWQEAIERDFNHPCIVAWVPVNESWGVPDLLNDERQRAHTLSLYYLIKSIDSTRLVVSNDGWEHTKSDLITIHDYDSRKESIKARYRDVATILRATPGGKLLLCEGFPYDDQPLMVTECGGIALKKNDWEGWGYSGATSEEDFIARYAAVVESIQESPVIQGFCYTQLTDVEQEINGLLTYDRKPKVPLDAIARVNRKGGSRV